MTSFLVAIFLGAFLLFQIQPLAARTLLPAFGGTPAVWITSMLFFQVLLVGGYGWGHLLSRLSPRLRRNVHFALLASSVVLLVLSALSSGGVPLLPNRDAADGGALQVDLLRRLALSVGLPYLVTATTGPVLQSWWTQRFAEHSPYRLYALSNAGSLLGLISYPLVVEPLAGLRGQAYWWCALYGIFLVATVLAALSTPLAPSPDAADAPAPAAPPTRGAFALWFTLTAIASTVLLAASNQLCQDMTSIPLLWVVPLALYLISFIIAFDRPSFYLRFVWMPLVFASIVACLYLIPNPSINIAWHLLAWCGLVLTASVSCHGELARLKPPPAHLTSFYLAVALGGATGGVLVALVAPRVFSAYYEVYLSFGALLILCTVVLYRSQRGHPLRVMVIAACCLVTFTLVRGAKRVKRNDQRLSSRSFFGVLRVTDTLVNDPERTRRFLSHGSTLHGMQLRAPDRRRDATTYYGAASGLGRAILGHPNRPQGLRLGVCGLGVGTVAAYLRESDTLRYYEIDPDVVKVATGDQAFFTFIPDAKGKVDIVLGDARVSLENERKRGSQNFDVLAVDAFSSDAIPVHLITREALEVYARQLGPRGVIAVHVTNRHLDLGPVVRSTAASVGFSSQLIYDEESRDTDTSPVWPSTWILIAPKPEALAPFGGADPALDHAVRPFSDDYSNIVRHLK